MLIEKLTNEIDGIEARIIQRESDNKYVVQFWDIDADESLDSIYVTPFLDIARREAKAFAFGIPGCYVSVR